LGTDQSVSSDFREGYIEDQHLKSRLSLQGTYLTAAARGHASSCGGSEEATIGAFNGVFWAVFASNQVGTWQHSLPVALLLIKVDLIVA
jgi:hypothetical protein